MAGTAIIQSVAKALDIMELLDQEGELGITEISQRLSLEKSTVFRALATLKARRYIIQNPDNSRYANSYKLFEMGHNVVRSTGLPKMAYPFMRQLAQETGEAVNLAIRDGTRAVYIEKIETADTIKVCMNVGQGIPLYCTGLGKALISYLPDQSVKTLLADEGFEQFTENTHRSLANLLADLAHCRRRGFAVDAQEHIRGIRCVASPVFNAKGETIAAVSVAGLQISNFTRQDTSELGQAVIRAAEAFTQTIGGRRPLPF